MSVGCQNCSSNRQVTIFGELKAMEGSVQDGSDGKSDSWKSVAWAAVAEFHRLSDLNTVVYLS